MRTTITVVFGALAVSLATGCNTGAIAPPVTALGPEKPAALPPGDRARFEEGLASMAKHERAGDWTEESCKETVDLLLVAKGRAVASYDAGLVERRCKHDARAKELFEAALAIDPKLQPARIALALARSAEPGGLDPAIRELTESVRETRFSDADALVALATLQARRNAVTSDGDGTDDADRARRNLQRALAIDDTKMDAMNQLALLQLERARAAAGSGMSAKVEGKKVATQALELAALLCTQAITKNARYAPIHNTLGLVEVELGNLSRAAASFDEAARLDPKLVEAHLNLAALNLQVRGFQRAEQAYRAVLAIRRDDYDAHVGLALALRGQIDDATEKTRVEAATKELATAEHIAPDRPEAYLNEAILVQEYGARGAAPDAVLKNLAHAKELYELFLAKADGTPALASARQRAKGRLGDLQQLAQVAQLPAGNPVP